MNAFTVAVILLVLAALAYQLGLVRSRGVAAMAVDERMHSRPGYHGLLAILRAAVPAALVFLLWRVLGDRAIDAMVLWSGSMSFGIFDRRMTPLTRSMI